MRAAVDAFRTGDCLQLGVRTPVGELLRRVTLEYAVRDEVQRDFKADERAHYLAEVCLADGPDAAALTQTARSTAARIPDLERTDLCAAELHVGRRSPEVLFDMSGLVGTGVQFIEELPQGARNGVHWRRHRLYLSVEYTRSLPRYLDASSLPLSPLVVREERAIAPSLPVAAAAALEPDEGEGGRRWTIDSLAGDRWHNGRGWHRHGWTETPRLYYRDHMWFDFEEWRQDQLSPPDDDSDSDSDDYGGDFDLDEEVAPAADADADDADAAADAAAAAVRRRQLWQGCATLITAAAAYAVGAYCSLST